MEDCYKTTMPDRYCSLKDNAHSMRNSPTEAEKMLWHYLRGNQLGVKFRRQHPFDDYVLDFVSLAAKLVVEVDGGYHLEEDQQEHDRMRDERLYEIYGFRTLRFTNAQIFDNLDDVVNIIKRNINVTK